MPESAQEVSASPAELRRPWRTFLSMRWSDQRRHLEAAMFLLLARTLIHTIPYRWLQGLIESNPLTSLVVRPLTRGSEIEKVVIAIRKVTRNSPTKFICFPRAIALKWMLNRRGYACVLCLGLKREETDMKAHAWVEIQGQVVLGGAEREPYSEIARLH